MKAIAAIMALLWVGWLVGWVHAHYTVAKECERLGSFYVGKKTFRCTLIEDRDDTA